MTTSLCWSVGAVDVTEWACILCGCQIQNEQVEQQICIKFCVKVEHSSLETILMIQKAEAMGNWWLAASSWQHACSCITSRAEFFVETSYHPGDSALLQPRFGALQLLVFPKTKISFEREEISDCWWWDSGKYNGAAHGDWENCVRSQGAYFEGDWGVTVLCTMFLVSSLINASTFHTAWLDTLWTDLIHDKSQGVHKNLYTNVHSSIIHTIPKVDTIQTFINWWINK